MGNASLRSVAGPPIPKAPRSCKAPTVKDIIELSAFASGRDPAWRHVTLHQHHQIALKVTGCFKAEDITAAAQGCPTASTKIKRGLEMLKTASGPALADEVNLARVARERFQRFQSGKTKEFSDLPFELRYTINVCGDSITGTQNDFSVPEQFRNNFEQGIAWAVKKKYLERDATGAVTLSEQTTTWLTKRLKRDPFAPAVSEHLLTLLRSEDESTQAKKRNTAGIDKLIPQHAVEQAKLLPGNHLKSSTQSLSTLLQPSPSTSKVDLRLGVIKTALENLESPNHHGLRDAYPALRSALTLMANSETPEEKKLGTKLLSSLGALRLVEAHREGRSAVGISFPFLLEMLPLLQEIKYGHEASQDLLTRIINYSSLPSITSARQRPRRIEYHQIVIESSQRAATDVLGTWLSRDKLPHAVQQNLAAALISQTSPFSAPLTISSALYWVHRNRGTLEKPQLRASIMRLVTDWEKQKHYHAVFIEAEALRDRKGPRFMGALEVAIDLLKESRLTPEDGKNIHDGITRYLANRRAAEHNSNNNGQRKIAEEILAELQALCGGALQPSAATLQTEQRKKLRQRSSPQTSKAAREKVLLKDLFESLSSPTSLRPN